MFRQIVKNKIYQKRGFYSMPPPRDPEPDPFFYGLIALGIIYLIKRSEPPQY
jgi:hypothetical protein